MHYLGHSHSQICINGYTCCERYQKYVPTSVQQKDVWPLNQYLACNQHSYCSVGCSLFCDSHVIGWSIAKFHCFNYTAMLMLLEDFGQLSENWMGNGGYMLYNTDGCCTGNIWYLHISCTNSRGSISR